MPGARRPALPGTAPVPGQGSRDTSEPGGPSQSRWLRGALQGIKARWGERVRGTPWHGPGTPRSLPAPWASLGGFTRSCRAVPSSAPAQRQDESRGEGGPK